MSGSVSIIGKGPSTRGTQVLVDGVPLKCVQRVVLTADVNDMRKAVITLIPDHIEVSDMDSTECEFVNGKVG